MVNMQLMMFLLVAVGFLVRKKNIIGETGRKDMVNFCLYVTLPFNICEHAADDVSVGCSRIPGEKKEYHWRDRTQRHGQFLSVCYTAV